MRHTQALEKAWTRLSSSVAERAQGLVVAGLYLAVVITAEALLAAGLVTAGLVVCVTLLLALVFQSAFDADPRLRRLCLALALLPLLRLAAASLTPVVIEFFEPAVTRAILAVVWLLAAALVMRQLDLTPALVGLRPGEGPLLLPAYFAAVILGPLAGLAQFGLLQAQPLIQLVREPWEVTVALQALGLFIGLVEALVFFGVVLQTARARLGSRVGVVFTAVLFAALQMGYLSWPFFLIVLLWGAGLGWATLKTRTLFPAILAQGLALATLLVTSAVMSW